jgi:hypothetical protein
MCKCLLKLSGALQHFVGAVLGPQHRNATCSVSHSMYKYFWIVAEKEPNFVQHKIFSDFGGETWTGSGSSVAALGPGSEKRLFNWLLTAGHDGPSLKVESVLTILSFLYKVLEIYSSDCTVLIIYRL